MIVSDAVYDDVIVNKPWGHEYLMYRNPDVALWCLSIRKGEQTSLHCHPRKKTGLIVLSGTATLRFLNNSNTLASPANVIIRPGLFHQTAANLGTDVVLIEVENPVDKMDLVRLDDEYGRARTEYEPISATRPLDSTCLRLPEPLADTVSEWELHRRLLRMYRRSDACALSGELEPADIVIILEGGLYTDNDDQILTAGDAVSSSTLSRLSRCFGSPRGIAALVVTDPARGVARQQA